MPTLQQIEEFKRKARQDGYSEIQISNEIARKNQEETKVNIKPQATTTQPTAEKQGFSLGGLVKNAGQDILDFAVNTPIQAVKNTIGAGFEITKSFDLNSKIKASRKKTEELVKLGNQIKNEKDPAKKTQLIAQARTLSGEVTQASQNLEKTASIKNPVMDTENMPTLKEMGKGILKNIGNTLGLTTDENGRLVFDINLALQTAYEHPATTLLVAKDLTKGLTRKAGVVKSAEKDVGFLEKTGTNLRKDVLNPKVEASPFYTEEIAALQKAQEKLGLKGSAQMQLEQLPRAFKNSQTEIQNLLKTSKPPQRGTLSGQFSKEIGDANYTLNDVLFSKAVEAEKIVLEKLDGKSASAMYEQMAKYRSLLKSTRKKIESGTTLLPKEEARLAAFNALKSTIDTVSPEVRALNSLQNQMFEISEGLVKSSKEKGAGLDILGNRVGVSTEITQGAKDLAGRTLQGASNLKEGVSSAVNKVPQVQQGTGFAMGASNILTQDLGKNPNAGGGYEDKSPIQNTENAGEQGNYQQYDENINQGENIIAPQSHPIFGTATKQEVLLDAFKKGANPKQLDEIEAIYDRFAPQEAKDQKFSATQQNSIADFDSSIELMNNLTTLVETNKSAFSPITSKARSLNPYDTDILAAQSQIKLVAQIVGKALEGGVLRKEDVPKYEAILPKVGDSPAVAKAKIQNVINALKIKKANLNSVVKNTVQSGIDLDSQLPDLSQEGY